MAEAVKVRNPEHVNWQREFLLLRQMLLNPKSGTPVRFRVDAAVHRGASVGSKARPACAGCWRPTRVCICATLPEKPYNNCAARVLVLLHPRCPTSCGSLRRSRLGPACASEPPLQPV